MMRGLSRPENQRLIRRIIFTSMFLVFSTVYIYIPQRTQLAAAAGFLNNYSNFKLNSISDKVVLSKAYPVADKNGMDGEDTKFEVVNGTSTDIYYSVVLKCEKLNKSLNYLDLSNIRYSISINGGSYSEAKNIPNDGILYKALSSKNSVDTYSLKLWIDYNADNSIVGKTFSASLSIEK